MPDAEPGPVGPGRRRVPVLALSHAASHGARVALTYRTHEPSAEVLDELADLSGCAPLALAVDVTDPGQVEELAATLHEELGTPDILVNNVGGLIRRAMIAEMDLELWRTVMATNLDSTFLVTHALLPMLRREGGRIISVSSLAGRNGSHPGDHHPREARRRPGSCRAVRRVARR